ncbi:MAG: DUF4384 domain-containing protein, partial [Azospirillaceae bacterium]
GGAAGFAPAQKSLVDVAVQPSELQVQAWTGRADATYAIGETFEMTLRANQDAYVTVFAVNAVGELDVLFPNPQQPDNFVAGGEALPIPAAGAGFEIEVRPPAGLNLVKVVASTEDRPVFETWQEGIRARAAGERLGAEALARQLSVVVTEDSAEGVDWATADLPVRVVAAAPVSAEDPSIEVVPTGPADGATGLLEAVAERPSAFGLQLALSRPAYQRGERLSLTVAAERSCRLHLLNIDAEGRATLLFPNTRQRDNRLSAGRVHFLPGADSGVGYRVAGAPGEQTLMALCQAEEEGLLALLGLGGRAATPVLSEASLSAVLEEIDALGAERLAHATAAYRVTR